MPPPVAVPFVRVRKTAVLAAPDTLNTACPGPSFTVRLLTDRPLSFVPLMVMVRVVKLEVPSASLMV